MQFQYEVKYYQRPYTVTESKSLTVPVCTTCRKRWKWADVLIWAPVYIVLGLGSGFLAYKFGNNAVSSVGITLAAIVLFGSLLANWVKGQRIKKWMKTHEPDEAKKAGLPY